MNNILIVDDEYLSRNKIRFLLNYAQYGFNIIGEAVNGRDAVAFLKSHPVDIIFTDVAMPEMDGIELAKYVKANCPNIQVVIMSNYSDFNYIKQAFSANVADYVLKHTLTAEVMRGLLDMLKENITDPSTHSPFTENLQKEAMYRQKIINAVIDTSTDFYPENSLILLLRINSERLRTPIYSNDEIDILYQNICNLIAQTIKDIKNFVIFCRENIIISYLPFPTDKTELDVMHVINQYIQQITASVYKFFNFNTLWGISCLSSKDYSLNQCYNEAKSMLMTAPFAGKKTPYPALNKPIYTLSIKQEKQLLSALSDLSMKRLTQCLDEIFSHVDPNSTFDILIGDLVSIAIKFCSDFKITFPDIPPLKSASTSSVSHLEWCKKMFNKIIENYKESKNLQRHSWYIQKVVSYIEKNYSKSISLKDIAKYIGISEQHLSTVFKKETGKPFSTYLTEYRIDRAKELLEQNEINLKQLYSEVGFNNYNYFFTVFKKYVGCTPETYRKSHVKRG